MENFRIFNVDPQGNSIFSSSIRFTSEEEKVYTSANYFSILIGNNGTGKSRLLRGIINSFLGRERRGETNPEVNYNYEPSKIIAITNSLSDKFPLDRSNRNPIKDTEYSHRESLYNYIGPKTRAYGFSSRAAIGRALDIIIENYTDERIAPLFRHIFKYLNYEPKLTINYRLRFAKLIKIMEQFGADEVTKEVLDRYIEDQIETGTSFGSRTLERNLAQADKNEFDEVLGVINYLVNSREKFANISIDFSINSLKLAEQNKSILRKNLINYKVLRLLSRSRLVSNQEIKVNKLDAVTFNLDDASSGEIGILSSLLALIPLVKDNSLILIDEPEISLHPTWQYKYVALLNEILDHVKGCHIIMATHSHFILSDIPNDSCTIIGLESSERGIKSRIIPKDTFGQSAEYILLNVFKVPSTRNWYVSQLLTEAMQLLADKKTNSNKFKSAIRKIRELYPDMKDTDPLKKVAEVIINNSDV